MPSVSVHIVTYNSLPFLEHLFRSLDAQSFRDFSVLVIDNASQDGTVTWLDGHAAGKANFQSFSMTVVKNKDNEGFARAHNRAIHFTDSSYVLALNADIILHETFLAQLVQALDAHPEAGSASGKLLQARGDPREIGTHTYSACIDSTGIVGDKKRFYRDRGAEEYDRGQYGANGLIIGPSGAAGIYRRTALDDIASGQEYFDALFDSYKEDVDLALRLKKSGWASRYVPSAVAYHYRRAGGGRRMTTRAIRHMGRPVSITFLSYRNHLYLLIKNESYGLFVRHFPWIFCWEFGKLVFLAVTKPWVIVKAWRDIMKNWKLLRAKRYQIQNPKSKIQNFGIPASRRIGILLF